MKSLAAILRDVDSRIRAEAEGWADEDDERPDNPFHYVYDAMEDAQRAALPDRADADKIVSATYEALRISLGALAARDENTAFRNLSAITGGADYRTLTIYAALHWLVDQISTVVGAADIEPGDARRTISLHSYADPSITSETVAQLVLNTAQDTVELWYAANYSGGNLIPPGQLQTMAATLIKHPRVAHKSWAVLLRWIARHQVTAREEIDVAIQSYAAHLHAKQAD